MVITTLDSLDLPDFSSSIDSLKNSGIRTGHIVVSSLATVPNYILSSQSRFQLVGRSVIVLTAATGLLGLVGTLWDAVESFFSPTKTEDKTNRNKKFRNQYLSEVVFHFGLKRSTQIFVAHFNEVELKEIKKQEDSVPLIQTRKAEKKAQPGIEEIDLKDVEDILDVMNRRYSRINSNDVGKSHLLQEMLQEIPLEQLALIIFAEIKKP